MPGIPKQKLKTLDASQLSPLQLQQYLQPVIAPRPIALVSTIDPEGNINLSPFSFFNLFSSNPPMCVFSPSRRVKDNTTKHTLENVRLVPECVIHVVTYDMVQQTSLSSTEYPKRVNEFDKAGFTLLPSDTVKPPRVAESPVQLECKVTGIIPIGDGPGAGNLVLAEIMRIHIRENLLDNDGTIDQRKLSLVGRLGGDWYCQVSEDNLFKVVKPVTGLGIGMDAMPVSVRLSKILTGNELAQLANLKEIPCKDQVRDFLNNQTEFIKHLNLLTPLDASRLNYIHHKAQGYIRKGDLQNAWLTLLAGINYMER